MRTELERAVQPSLLDRLTDDAPQVPADPPTTQDASARAFRAGVLRDLAWLLNTRRSIEPLPPGVVELRRSVHQYGLPDTTGIPIGDKYGRQTLVAQLTEAIERFEPRLDAPRVTVGQLSQVLAPQVRFGVEATLRMDPSPEAVSFDAVLEVARGEFEVGGDRPAPRQG